MPDSSFYQRTLSTQLGAKSHPFEIDELTYYDIGDDLSLIAALTIYLLVLYGLGWRASQKIQTVEDFVLAGRSLPLAISTIALVATWFGAESIITVANEVAAQGIRRAMLDPFGIALCLAMAGCLVARGIWRMNILTLGDFFRIQFGPATEQVAAWIIIPSYFGWIATQLTSLALVFHTLLGWPVEWTMVAIACIGTGYCFMGGMFSVSWIDVVQMLLIALGLIVVAAAVAFELNSGSNATNTSWLQNAPSDHWRIASKGTFVSDLSTALGALAIGSIGNLSTQDLFQRILSAKSETVAVRACWLASLGYLLLGLFPMFIGLGAACLDSAWLDSEQDVLTVLAQRYLTYPAQVAFVLAITSAVLSTFSSAVMSPAALLAQNLIGPTWQKRSGREWSTRGRIQLQRVCIVLMALMGLLVSFAGRSAYELLQASYAICFVSLTVPLLVGLHSHRRNPTAAIGAMLAGFAVWCVHFCLGWDWFLEPWCRESIPVPQEVAAALASGLAYSLLAWLTPLSAKPDLALLNSR